MTFVNHTKVEVLARLKGMHYGFPRAASLRDALGDTLDDYYAKASLGKVFEARGLLVTGPSRIGKTTEIRKLIDDFNLSGTVMPDGRPAKFVSVMLKGILTWKDLGLYTLRMGMGFRSEKRMTQTEVWRLVLFQAKTQGIVGIHFDECQHIFPKEGRAERGKILNSFKSMLKEPEWPMMLVLSGVEELAKHIKSDGQLDALLDDVAFSEFDMHHGDDVTELNTLCHAYAETVGLDFSDLGSMDFYQRLAFACADRWGLVIELLINALVIAVLDGNGIIRSDHFCRAFTKGTNYRPGISPFSINDFEKHFERRKLAELWDERQKAHKSG